MKVKIPGRLHRAGEIDMPEPPAEPPPGAEPPEDDRRVTLAFSSEAPVVREYEIAGKMTACREVLGHGAGEFDLSPLESGRAPLLVDHVQSVDSQVGVVERAWIEDGRGRAVVRFGKSARADEILARVRDGELSGVSVGYEITALAPAGEQDGMPVLRAQWRPFEITLCPVPADPTVGVGRAAEVAEREISVSVPDEESTMTKETTATATAEVKAPDLAAERARVKLIRAMGKKFRMSDEAVDKAIEEGRSEAEFQKEVLDEIGSEEQETTRSRNGMVGLTDKEIRSFSLLRAARYLANPNDQRARREAAFEIEVSQAAETKLKRSAQGLLVPADVLAHHSFTRAVEVNGGTNTAAQKLVATDHQSGSFIEMLRKKAALTRLGVRTLTGLEGNVEIPRQASGASAFWVGEGGAPTESTPGFNALSLTPHTLAAAVGITRRALIQTTPDVEALIRDDLIQTMALEIDAVGINGSADTDAPDGLLDQAISLMDFAAATAAPTWAEVVGMESQIAADDADVETMRWLMRPAMRGYLKATPKVAGTAEFMMQGNEVNGYEAVTSNNGPAAGAILGNWSDFILAMWSGLDLTVDTATLAASGGIMLRAFQDVDFGVRHAKSFVHGR